MPFLKKTLRENISAAFGPETSSQLLTIMVSSLVIEEIK